jgi:hypothetical protein
LRRLRHLGFLRGPASGLRGEKHEKICSPRRDRRHRQAATALLAGTSLAVTQQRAERPPAR